MRAHLPFVCVKSSTIIFTFPFSICCETTGYFHCFSTWRVNMVAWTKPQTNCHCANYTPAFTSNIATHSWLFPAFFCYGCHQAMVVDEVFLKLLFVEPRCICINLTLFLLRRYKNLIQMHVLNSIFFLSIKIIIFSSLSNINEACMQVSPPRYNSIIEVIFSCHGEHHPYACCCPLNVKHTGIGGEYMKDHILKYFPYNFALFYSYIPNSCITRPNNIKFSYYQNI